MATCGYYGNMTIYGHLFQANNAHAEYETGPACPVLYILYTLHVIIVVMCYMYNIYSTGLLASSYCFAVFLAEPCGDSTLEPIAGIQKKSTLSRVTCILYCTILCTNFVQFCVLYITILCTILYNFVYYIVQFCSTSNARTLDPVHGPSTLLRLISKINIIRQASAFYNKVG